MNVSAEALSVEPALRSARRPVSGQIARSLLLLLLAGYTVFSAGPFLWLASMSLRTTSEISANHYALPSILHWEKFPAAWFGSSYGTYFLNSLEVVVAAVIVLTLIGAMAAFAFAR
jgi:ABC-type glycerol-3-phosphate transport system permease component